MKRLESLDVLRGMDMFMILCAGWSPLIFLCEAFGMPDCWLVAQCHHAKWGAGVTIIDLVFPTFLFIAAVTFPYSLARQREKGATGWSTTTRRRRCRWRRTACSRSTSCIRRLQQAGAS